MFYFNKFAPSSDPFTMISAFSYIRRRIYTQWEKEALALFPSNLETTIVTKVYPVVFGDTPDLIIVVSPGKGLESIRVKFSAGRVQLLTVVLRQLCAKRVDRDDKGTAISLELFQRVESIEKYQEKLIQNKKSDHNQDQSLILTFITF